MDNSNNQQNNDFKTVTDFKRWTDKKKNFIYNIRSRNGALVNYKLLSEVVSDNSYSILSTGFCDCCGKHYKNRKILLTPIIVEESEKYWVGSECLEYLLSIADLENYKSFISIHDWADKMLKKISELNLVFKSGHKHSTGSSFSYALFTLRSPKNGNIDTLKFLVFIVHDKEESCTVRSIQGYRQHDTRIDNLYEAKDFIIRMSKDYVKTTVDEIKRRIQLNQNQNYNLSL